MLTQILNYSHHFRAVRFVKSITQISVIHAKMPVYNPKYLFLNVRVKRMSYSVCNQLFKFPIFIFKRKAICTLMSILALSSCV